MNDPELTEQMHAAAERLEAETERRRAIREQPFAPAEQFTAAEGSRGSILSIAEVMPETLQVMDRIAKKWSAFCESQREAFAGAPESVSCHDHPSEARMKLFEESCQQSRREGYFSPVYAPCSQCADESTKAAHRRFWRKRGVPERVVDATISNFDMTGDNSREKTETQARVRAWIKRNGVFLILHGSTGTGKGHLAAGCLKAQQNGLFITHADLMMDLRHSYTIHTTKELIETWQEAEMFVLDEFGLSVGGKDEEPVIYQILAERYDKRRPTIITTNQTRDALREQLGYRLLDRIREDVTECSMRWESRRAR